MNVIYIIGESYIKRHSSLYGYPLKTSPRLEEEQKNGNLFVFYNVISPYNATSPTMKNTLCCNSITDGEKWYNSPYFPSLFKKSGFDVFYWDAQRDDSAQGLWVFSMSSFLFNKTISKISYTATTYKHFDYDNELVTDFEKTRKTLGRLNLIIFHLWGQHVDASARFPHNKEFCRFGVRDIKRKDKYLTDSKRQDIANYDNATLYNDFVVGHIINLYRDKNTVVVYLSDHGEEVYDYRDSKGRVAASEGQLSEYLKCQFDVPFVVWCSDKYKEKHPQIIKEIKTSLNRPFMTDNVCQILFHLSGLHTIYYKAEHDLLSPNFKPKDRFVNGGINYDKVKRENKR